jgi:Tol biopolymer transport system component
VSVASGETAPLFQDSQILGFDPKWSPDGNRIAFFDGSAGGIRVLDIQSGHQEVLESQLGLVGEFSPDGTRMLFGVLNMHGNQPVSELFLADFERKEVTSIIGADSTFADPGIPAWSPTGEWVVLNLRTNLGGPGKELWLMHPDGSDARPIVRDPAYDYGGYSWDPWGTAILFQRFPLGVADGRPEVMIWYMGDAEPHVVTSDAWWGRWLP